MKRNFGTLATAVLVAGVAGALGLAPTTHVPRPAASAESKPVLAQASPAPEQSASPVKPTVEVHQAPVPLLIKSRPTIEVPPAEEQQSPQQEEAKAPAAMGSDGAGANDAVGGAAAKAAVEADGYKGVKVLRKGDNGLWYAEGLRGSTKVLLMVDAQGNVTSQ